MRTDFCGRITEEYLDQEVTVCGWIHRRRDHGGVIFLDVRDLKGICQAVISPDNKDAFALADSCRSEYVIQVTGKVRPNSKEPLIIRCLPVKLKLMFKTSTY